MDTDTPQKEQTGGLKLMTVFIFVLALHVLVIGGFTVYHFIKGENKDTVAADATKTDSTVAKSTDDAGNTSGAPSIQTDDQTSPKVAAGDATKPADSVDADAATPGFKASVPAPSAVLAPVENVDSSTVVDSKPNAPVTKPMTPVTKPGVSTAVGMNTPVASSVVAPQSGGASYTVKSGDTPTRIAKRNGMTVAELKKLNGLTSDNIKVGQNLRVKSSTATSMVAATAAPAVEAPATTMSAAPAVASTNSAPVSAASGTTYKVNPGDTLIKIARKYKTTAAAIMAANNIVDANKLKVGINLIIPQKADKRSVTDTTAPVAPTQTASASPDLVMNR